MQYRLPNWVVIVPIVSQYGVRQHKSISLCHGNLFPFANTPRPRIVISLRNITKVCAPPPGLLVEVVQAHRLIYSALVIPRDSRGWCDASCYINLQFRHKNLVILANTIILPLPRFRLYIMATQDSIVSASAKYPRPTDSVFQYGTAGVCEHPHSQAWLRANLGAHSSA